MPNLIELGLRLEAIGTEENMQALAFMQDQGKKHREMLYRETRTRLVAARLIYHLMESCEDGGGYASLWHAYQHLIYTMPEYPGSRDDRHWIELTMESEGLW